MSLQVQAHKPCYQCGKRLQVYFTSALSWHSCYAETGQAPHEIRYSHFLKQSARSSFSFCNMVIALQHFPTRSYKQDDAVEAHSLLEERILPRKIPGIPNHCQYSFNTSMASNSWRPVCIPPPPSFVETSLLPSKPDKVSRQEQIQN